MATASTRWARLLSPSPFSFPRLGQDRLLLSAPLTSFHLLGSRLDQERLLVEWLLADPGVAVAVAPHAAATHDTLGVGENTNVSEGWCVGNASDMLPPSAGVLRRMRIIARGEGRAVVAKLLANEHAERGPIGEGDLRLERWHRPLRMRACARAGDNGTTSDYG